MGGASNNNELLVQSNAHKFLSTTVHIPPACPRHSARLRTSVRNFDSPTASSMSEAKVASLSMDTVKEVASNIATQMGVADALEETPDEVLALLVAAGSGKFTHETRVDRRFPNMNQVRAPSQVVTGRAMHKYCPSLPRSTTPAGETVPPAHVPARCGCGIAQLLITSAACSHHRTSANEYQLCVKATGDKTNRRCQQRYRDTLSTCPAYMVSELAFPWQAAGLSHEHHALAAGRRDLHARAMQHSQPAIWITRGIPHSSFRSWRAGRRTSTRVRADLALTVP